MTLETKICLDDRDEIALARLLASCEEADGYAELPLDKSLNQDQDFPSFFLAWEGEELLGILSVFSPMAEEAEITAFVHPEWRRKGIFDRLLGTCEAELIAIGCIDELFVCESGEEGGAAAVESRGAVKDFTEYALSFPPDGEGRELLDEAVAQAPVELRPARAEDFEALVDLMSAAFNNSRENEESIVRASLAGESRKQFIALAEGRIIGAAAVGYEDNRGSIHGVAVAPALRGRGYGKCIVATLARQLLAEGRQALINVDTTNAMAFHVYTALGFRVERAIDYWRRSLPR